MKKANYSRLTRQVYSSPIGEIISLSNNDALCYLDFCGNDERMEQQMRRRYGNFVIDDGDDFLNMAGRLARYFDKDWSAFDDLPIDSGGRCFSGLYGEDLVDIPFGQTISYQYLAEAIDRPQAIRAAASANARNPIAIIVPCHRVIGKGGDLRGYAGGLERKQWLLQHENAI